MTTAGQVATELRKLADALDKEPETEIDVPLVMFSYWTNKQGFIDLAKILPKPLTKSYIEGAYSELRIEYNKPAIRIISTIQRSAVCEIVEPAKPAVYNCVPLLSLEEEASLAGGNDAQV